MTTDKVKSITHRGRRNTEERQEVLKLVTFLLSGLLRPEEVRGSIR